MEIKRDRYLNLLISKKHNGLIKVITGMRRCGKSYLLFTLFKDYLLSEGIEKATSLRLRLMLMKQAVPRSRCALSLPEGEDQRRRHVLCAA